MSRLLNLAACCLAALAATACGQEAATMPTAQQETASGGYLFATFKGEGSPMGEQVYFGLSRDGLEWQPLHDGEPALVSQIGEKGVRDPFLLRLEDDGGFVVIATDLSVFHIDHDWGRAVTRGSRNVVIWTSPDLAQWSPPTLVEVAPEDAGCTWAPQSIYDRERGEYLVYWASTTAGDDFAKHRIWAVYTPDFKTFGDPFVYLERDDAVIDTDIIFDPDSDRYYRFSKNETTKAIDMQASDSINGEWSDVAGYSLGDLRGYEGPACYRLRNKYGSMSDRWCLLLDHYARGEGYKAWTTDDLSSGKFEPSDAIEFPFRFRHGSVLPLTDEEYERVEAAG